MRLRINGPVPGRKQKPNPETITGYPQMGLLRQAVERAKRYSFRLDELRIYAKDRVIELYNVSVEQFIRQDLLFKLYADSMEYMKKHHSPDYWKQASNELARGRTWYNLIHLD
jgi:hypothetical protein